MTSCRDTKISYVIYTSLWRRRVPERPLSVVITLTGFTRQLLITIFQNQLFTNFTNKSMKMKKKISTLKNKTRRNFFWRLHPTNSIRSMLFPWQQFRTQTNVSRGKMPELTEDMYCSQQINIPPTFPYLLRQYAKAAIRTQPSDLLR